MWVIVLLVHRFNVKSYFLNLSVQKIMLIKKRMISPRRGGGGA